MKIVHLFVYTGIVIKIEMVIWLKKLFCQKVHVVVSYDVKYKEMKLLLK